MIFKKRKFCINCVRFLPFEIVTFTKDVSTKFKDEKLVTSIFTNYDRLDSYIGDRVYNCYAVRALKLKYPDIMRKDFMEITGEIISRKFLSEIAVICKLDKMMLNYTKNNYHLGEMMEAYYSAMLFNGMEEEMKKFTSDIIDYYFEKNTNKVKEMENNKVAKEVDNKVAKEVDNKAAKGVDNKAAKEVDNRAAKEVDKVVKEEKQKGAAGAKEENQKGAAGAKEENQKGAAGAKEENQKGAAGAKEEKQKGAAGAKEEKQKGAAGAKEEKQKSVVDNKAIKEEKQVVNKVVKEEKQKGVVDNKDKIKVNEVSSNSSKKKKNRKKKKKGTNNESIKKEKKKEILLIKG